MKKAYNTYVCENVYTCKRNYHYKDRIYAFQNNKGKSRKENKQVIQHISSFAQESYVH